MAASLSIKLGRVSSTGTPHGLQDQQSSSQSVTAASHSPFCTERRRHRWTPIWQSQGHCATWRERRIQGQGITNIRTKGVVKARRIGPPPGGALKIEARGSGKAFMFDIADNFVLLEPDEDETFVSQIELKEKLRPYLENWPGKSLPDDLASFASIDEALDYLVGTACELQLGAGQGTIQWFEVRLEH